MTLVYVLQSLANCTSSGVEC